MNEMITPKRLSHKFNYALPIDNKNGAVRFTAQFPQPDAKNKGDQVSGRRLMNISRGDYASLKMKQYQFDYQGLRAEFLCAADQDKITQL